MVVYLRAHYAKEFGVSIEVFDPAGKSVVRTEKLDEDAVDASFTAQVTGTYLVYLQPIARIAWLPDPTQSPWPYRFANISESANGEYSARILCSSE